MYVFKRIQTIQKPTTNEKKQETQKNQQNKQKKLKSEKQNFIFYTQNYFIIYIPNCMYYGNRKYLTSFLSLPRNRKGPNNDTKKNQEQNTKEIDGNSIEFLIEYSYNLTLL